MVSRWVVVASLSTKPVRWRHVLHVAAVAATVVAAAAVATVVAAIAPAVAATVAAAAVAAAATVAAAVVVVAAVVATTADSAQPTQHTPASQPSGWLAVFHESIWPAWLLVVVLRQNIKQGPIRHGIEVSDRGSQWAVVRPTGNRPSGEVQLPRLPLGRWPPERLLPPPVGRSDGIEMSRLAKPSPLAGAPRPPRRSRGDQVCSR